MNYGDRFRQIRKELGATQKELAEHLGVKQNIISRYESGEYQIPDEIKFKLHILGIDLTWLITGEGQMLREESEIASLKKEIALLEANIHHVQTQSDELANKLVKMKNVFS